MKPTPLKQHLTEFSSIYITQALFNGCFYGIRAIFVLYAIHHHFLAETHAISLFATFMILCYATSLMGGYIADKGLGVKNTIMVGGLFSALGLLLLLSSFDDLCFLGLALASLGSGFFKPNISTAVGLIFKDPKDPRKDRVYSIFYMAANAGSLIAMIVCGVVGQIHGWHYGIILLALVFIGATYFVYKTIHFHPTYKEETTLSKIKLIGGNLFLITFLYLLFKYREYFHSLMGIITCGSIFCLGTIFYHCNSQERKDILIVILYILLFSIFCTLFEQAGTSLILFYEKAVDRQVMGTVIPSSTFLSLDPLFVLICGPILLFLSTKYLEKKKPLEGPVKIGYGFLCVTLGFGILALSTYQNQFSLVSPFWIVGAMFVQTIGELWIAPVSFSKISQYAPIRFKSILMSFWSMAIAYGHYCAGFIAKFSLNGPTSLCCDNSFERYRTFFLHLSILPLCVGLSLLLYKMIQNKISRRGKRSIYSSRF